MMLYVVFPSPGNANQMQLLTNMLYGWPRRGRRASDGAPVGPETPSPGNRYGWTTDQYDILYHPTDKSVCAHPAVDPDTEGDISHLSAQQAQMLQDWSATAIALTSDWFPDV